MQELCGRLFHQAGQVEKTLKGVQSVQYYCTTDRQSDRFLSDAKRKGEKRKKPDREKGCVSATRSSGTYGR